MGLLGRRGLLALATATAWRAHAQPAAPAVAAASDLQFALPEGAERFRLETGIAPRLAFGSSGNFTRQIEQGAPYELFLSADESFVRRLVDRGLTQGDGALYGIGRLVLVAPRGSPLRPADGLDGLRAALQAGRIRRFAIANPEHAPYGRAAEQALRAAGLWEVLQRHLVFGENVSQALQFATVAGAEGGIVALSLVLAPSVHERVAHTPLPTTLHDPLRQRMVLTRRAGPAAARFFEYLSGPAAREIMRRYGFILPDE
ncbi:MAG TPA: molybdate ABC transporter substrate-binding protein [Acetobacteraceae bacterium]|nr:molybdate ABC transporter substrate-binding protein [Acetobacteraceae bacterium]